MNRANVAIDDAIVNPQRAEFAPSAGIPFMFTADMKARLAGRGFTPEQISELTPAQAHEILSQPITPEREAKPAPSPFGLAGPRLLDMGYHPIPICDKRPAHRGVGLTA